MSNQPKVEANRLLFVNVNDELHHVDLRFAYTEEAEREFLVRGYMRLTDLRDIVNREEKPPEEKEEQIMQGLMDLHLLLMETKPNDRTSADRQYAVCLTKLEDALIRYERMVYKPWLERRRTQGLADLPL